MAEPSRLHSGCTARAPLSRGCSPGAARMIVGAPGVPESSGVISKAEASRYSPPCTLIVTPSSGLQFVLVLLWRGALPAMRLPVLRAWHH